MSCFFGLYFYEAKKRFLTSYFVSIEDLNWENFYVQKIGHRIFNIFIKVICSIILLFASSPAYIFYFLTRIELNPDQGRDDPSPELSLNYFLDKFVPPLIIIGINRLIIIALLSLSKFTSELGKPSQIFQVPEICFKSCFYVYFI